VKSAVKPRSKAVQGFHEIRLVIIINSPIKLGNGGSARLAAEVKSHHVVARGVISFSPRFNASVRVWVRS